MALDHEDLDEDEDDDIDDDGEDEYWETVDDDLTEIEPSDDLTNVEVKAISDVLEGSEVDELTREVTVWAPSRQQVAVPEKVSSLEELRELLGELGWGETERHPLGYHGSNPYSSLFLGGERLVSRDAIDSAIRQTDIALLFKGKIVLPESALYRLETQLVIPSVGIELTEINEELIRYLGKHPKALHDLDPRKFEELIAELFRDFGYQVLLTPQTRDGGCDIRAFRKDSVGELLYLIECKRYKASRPVSVDLVRGLYGLSQSENASCGVLVTTSRFTKDAREFALRRRYQLSLKDYNDLVAWLGKYRGGKSG